MFFIRSFVCFLVLFGFGKVKADFVKINWNISTRQKYSFLEREYKYPMYEDVAPAPCDLTDSCDVFCQQDPDCNESQKRSFQTSKSLETCKDPLSSFDCGCTNFDRPEWLSAFCYVFKNPVYLGKFYKTPPKVEKLTDFKKLISSKYLFKHEVAKPRVINQLHSPIMTFVPMSESFPSVNPLVIKTAIKDSSNACVLNPVRYRLNHFSVCVTRITPELCENGHALSVFPYLVQGNNISSNIPVVSKDSDILKGVKSEVSLKCVKLRLITKKFKNQKRNYFLPDDINSCDDSFNTYRTVLSGSICQNVLVNVHHKFILNGSDIVEVKVEYTLGDVPLSLDANQKYIYLKQKFIVDFIDIMNNTKHNYTTDDELLSRGYFVGEELNFGYKHIKNSSVLWEKGMLGVFKNGGSCDDLFPITFGFDYFSVCHIRLNSANCSQLRAVAEEKFERLLKGDALAVNGNLREPYNNSAPLLRNYPNSSDEKAGICTIPTGQDILIQYTSFFTLKGVLVHRILGIRIDRGFQSITDDKHIGLTSRVLFSYVSSSKEKPLSKFWTKMYSRERSENSWLYFLNAFDDVTASEREEIFFWSISIVLLVTVVGATSKLDYEILKNLKCNCDFASQ